MKHTPAPWRVDLDFKHTAKDYHQITALDGPRSNAPGFSLTGCIGIEDARLIAAAPELLEALEDVLHHHVEFGGLHADTAQKIINAINKAKGL